MKRITLLSPLFKIIDLFNFSVDKKSKYYFDHQFIVTSCILTKTLSDIEFSTHERHKQTIQSLISIRNFYPNANIILLDNSGFFRDKENLKLYKHHSDIIIDFSSNIFAIFFNKFNNKSIGESFMLYKFIVGHNFLGKNIYKLSGRYFLHESNARNFFIKNKFNFKKYKNNVSTRFYMVPFDLISIYKKQLLKSFIASFFGFQIEDTIALGNFKDKINFVDEVGVSGYIGGNRKVFIYE